MALDLSVCMIVKNEEEYIGAALTCSSRFADEIIVVDTGSTDATKKIAAAFPKVKLCDFEWCDDFSAARNYSLEQAAGRWIVRMDADDWIEPPACALINENKKDPCDCGFAFTMRSVCVPEEAQFLFTDKEIECPQIRMFPNRPDIRYRGLLHESIDMSFKETVLPLIGILDIQVLHYGYHSMEALREKYKRNHLLGISTYGFPVGSEVKTYMIDGCAVYHVGDHVFVWGKSLRALRGHRKMVVPGQALPDDPTERTALALRVAAEILNDPETPDVDAEVFKMHEILARLSKATEKELLYA